MKTRIISGAVLVLITASVLIVNLYFPISSVIAVMLLSAAAVYEVLNNTGIVKCKLLIVPAMAYAALMPLVYSKALFPPVIATVLFILILIFVTLSNHKKISVGGFTATAVFPIILSYAFYSICGIINFKDSHGLFYFLLLINFSSIADCGAYFFGTAFGKHKLAPELSPKKTVEGSVGGLISSMLVTLLMVPIYNSITGGDVSLVTMLVATPIFAVLGMAGDIFASFIKRSCGIKDYSNLIPGHGGILDRFDSILLIAPVFLFCISLKG